MTVESDRSRPTWEEYYKERRDLLTHDLGKLETIDRRKYDPVEWDAATISTCRDLLDCLNILRNETLAMRDKIEQVEESMLKIAKAHITYIEKQDGALKSEIQTGNEDTKRSLEALHVWIKNWEPLLKLVRIDYHDKLERVGNIDESE